MKLLRREHLTGGKWIGSGPEKLAILVYSISQALGNSVTAINRRPTAR